VIVHECVQGTNDWVRLRIGIPTASQFHRIFQPVRRKPSESRGIYLLELLDEWVSGQREEPFENKWTTRGREMEPEARFGYEMEHGAVVRQVGFVTRDDGLCGGSPDGLVGDDTVLEIKVPSPQIHSGIVAGKKPGHTAQCQGLLYVCERSKAHLWTYSPTGESVLHEIDRDDEMIAEMVPVLDEFCAELEAEKQNLAAIYGWDSLRTIGSRQ